MVSLHTFNYDDPSLNLAGFSNRRTSNKEFLTKYTKMYFLFLKAIHLGQMKDKFVGIFNGHDLYENELIRAQLYTIHRSLE